MPMSDEDRKKLAKEIVKAFFSYIDESVGSSVRKKLFYIIIGLIVAAGIATGVIHITPKGIS